MAPAGDRGGRPPHLRDASSTPRSRRSHATAETHEIPASWRGVAIAFSTPVRRLLTLGTLVAVTLAGCGGPVVRDLSPRRAPSTIDAATLPPDSFESLLPPLEAHDDLCAPDNDIDRVTEVFCRTPTPEPHGLAELMTLLGLDFKDPNGGNGVGGNPGFAILGHSSALTARKVSTILPTAFVFTPPVGGRVPQDYTFLAFDPGEHFVEVASNAPGPDGGLNLYLILFDQDCLTAPGGCTNADLFTPALTTGWKNLRVYEDSGDLANTVAGCPVCHDPQNSGERMLRMQEINAPFTHWFSSKTVGGSALLSDFHAAHGAAEDYGPIPAAMIDQSDPAMMARVITALGFEQPNAFDSAAIENEVCGSDTAQPWQNVPAGGSRTWDSLYEAAVAGTVIAPPYHDVKVTDPVKLAAMSSAYQQFLGGQTSELPDIGDVFLDDGLRDMGFAPKLGLDGKGLLAQTCQECHNASLDPEISRDRFRVDQLDRMSRKERDIAITRLGLGLETRFRMPPQLFRTITDAERQLMIDELRKDPTKH